MNRITVSIKLLKEKISEMENNQISFVELSLVPEQMEQSEINPAFLHFEGIEKMGSTRILKALMNRSRQME